ncbi:MAG: hypothetical protein JJE07_06485 [Flavobacteriaceae bacterium]|nr:hypothetical protein [Flavobacteriaceae bacterium]
MLLPFATQLQDKLLTFAIVKFSAIILSLFFLVLTFVPCADDGSSFSVETGQIAEGHLDHTGATEMCPPFCECQCCNSQIITSNPVAFEPINFEISKLVDPYKNKIHKDIFISFMQPPQI